MLSSAELPDPKHANLQGSRPLCCWRLCREAISGDSREEKKRYKDSRMHQLHQRKAHGMFKSAARKGYGACISDLVLWLLCFGFSACGFQGSAQLKRKMPTVADDVRLKPCRSMPHVRRNVAATCCQQLCVVCVYMVPPVHPNCRCKNSAAADSETRLLECANLVLLKPSSVLPGHLLPGTKIAKLHLIGRPGDVAGHSNESFSVATCVETAAGLHLVSAAGLHAVRARRRLVVGDACRC